MQQYLHHDSRNIYLKS